MTPEVLPDGFVRTTELFRVTQRDGSLWVEDIDGGPDDGWILVPDSELDALIKALQEARVAKLGQPAPDHAATKGSAA